MHSWPCQSSCRREALCLCLSLQCFCRCLPSIGLACVCLLLYFILFLYSARLKSLYSDSLPERAALHDAKGIEQRIYAANLYSDMKKLKVRHLFCLLCAIRTTNTPPVCAPARLGCSTKSRFFTAVFHASIYPSQESISYETRKYAAARNKRVDEQNRIRRSIQRLLLFIHAKSCKDAVCRDPQYQHMCAQYKDLFNHTMKCKDNNCKVHHCTSVSYTHLTLPTIYSV